MTYQALLCAITANTGRRFILSDDEVNRIVIDYRAEALLDDRNLFWESVQRFLKDNLPAQMVLHRLVAIFGSKRVAVHVGRRCNAIAA